jgi:hypothetical protein
VEWSERVITELPLRSLWDDSGPVPATWSRDLSVLELRELLRQGTVRFVVAEVGAKPRWVLAAGCFDFWKREVQAHLAEPDQGADLERFPGGYGYFATEWQGASGSPIVVLQRCH